MRDAGAECFILSWCKGGPIVAIFMLNTGILASCTWCDEKSLYKYSGRRWPLQGSVEGALPPFGIRHVRCVGAMRETSQE
jgi:hypothetical protein